MGNNVIVTAVSYADAKQYQSRNISIVEKSQAFSLDVDDNGSAGCGGQPIKQGATDGKGMVMKIGKNNPSSD